MIKYIILLSFLLNPLDGMYVDKDAIILSKIITAECSICSEDEQYLVGSTVLNRVDDSRYPNSVKGVIMQENQYHGITSQWFVTTTKTLEIAKNLLDGQRRDYDIFFFYARDSPNKSFLKKMEPCIKYNMEYHIYACGI